MKDPKPMHLIVQIVIVFLTCVDSKAAIECFDMFQNESTGFNQNFSFNTASVSDLLEMARLDYKIWGASMAVSRGKLLSRMQTFRSGQIVLKANGKILGFINSQKISRRIEDSSNQSSWAAITDNGYIKKTHDPEGNTLFLINISVDFEKKQAGQSRSSLGMQLIDRILRVAADEKVTFVQGVTRLNGFKSFYERQKSGSQIDWINIYIEKVVRGELRDPALSFHLKKGAIVTAPIKNAMPDDVDSLEWGALITYNVP